MPSLPNLQSLQVPVKYYAQNGFKTDTASERIIGGERADIPDAIRGLLLKQQNLLLAALTEFPIAIFKMVPRTARQDADFVLLYSEESLSRRIRQVATAVMTGTGKQSQGPEAAQKTASHARSESVPLNNLVPYAI
jgi:hypothetical protein